MTNNQNESLTTFSLTEILNKDFSQDEWLVEGLIPNQGITSITGKAGVGKSYLSLYLAKCISQGEPMFDNFDTTQKSVCVITKEDPQRLIKKRLKKLGLNESSPVVFCDDMSAFCNSEEQLNRIEELLVKTGSSVLIIDSFIRVIGGDENLSKDVTKVHDVFKKLIQRGYTVIFIHHQGKENFGKSGIDKPRGSSDIGAMVDSLLIVSVKDKVLTINQAKNRWDEEIPTFCVKLDYSFLGFLKPIPSEIEQSSIDQAKNDVFELVAKSPEPLHQAGIIKKLEEGGVTYSSSTIKNALVQMIGIQLDAAKSGGKKYFTLKDSPEQLSNQSSNTDIQLSNATEPEALEAIVTREVI